MADYDKTPSYALAGKIGLLGHKPTVPEMPYVDPTAVGKETLQNAMGLLPDLRDLAKAAGRFESSQLLKSWEKLMPGFSGLRDQAGGLASSFMKGEIPADVLRSIQDAVAAASSGRGTSGSTFQLADTTRSLGLTSLDLTGKGASIYSNMANMFMQYAPLRGFAGGVTGSAMPLNAPQTGSMMQWNEQQRFNQQMMKNVIEAMPSPAQTALANAWGQIDADIQDFFKTAYGGGGASAMGSKMGGGGGGGGGGGMGIG